MKVTRTFTELQRFNLVAGAYLKKHEAAENKLCRSIRQFVKQLQGVFDEMNEEFETIRIDNCAVDEKTQAVLTTPEGGYQFTKDGLRAVAAANKISYKREFTLDARMVGEVPPDLTEEEQTAFSGIVIPQLEVV